MNRVAERDRADTTFIAVDWGTTNCRAYRVSNGAVDAQLQLDAGVSGLTAADYPALVGRFRAELGDHAVLASGMVGSTLGWMVAPYLAAPADIAAIAGAVVAAPVERVFIVPGVSLECAKRCDVMRGEEVQFLGALGLIGGNDFQTFIQPGTHSKWATIEHGRIVTFTTAMTGELFGLLRDNSVLAEMLQAAPAVTTEFARGLEAARGNLLVALFSLRASVLLGRQNAGDAPSFLSGLLVGSELLGLMTPGERVGVVADGVLGQVYSVAIDRMGGVPMQIDGTRAYIAGISAIWSIMR